MARTAIITLTTDFGLNDHFIGAMKGVILEIAPDAQIIDISHAVQPFDILDGALFACAQVALAKGSLRDSTTTTPSAPTGSCRI